MIDQSTIQNDLIISRSNSSEIKENMLKKIGTDSSMFKNDTIKIETSNFIFEKTSDVRLTYRILSIIGKGSFGTIYKVQHISSGLFRAMKTIKKTYISMQDDEQKFLKEIEILMQVDHPNIIKIFEYYTDEVNFMLITEFIGGGDLYASLIKFKVFSEENAANIMYQLLSAVSYLHSKNIVRRDIKPENILVDTLRLKKNEISIKLVDFGTSNYFNKGCKLSLKMGSPYYIAPEVLNDCYNEKCDMWSCGILMYILITGKPPFIGKSVTHLIDNVMRGSFDNIEANLKKVSPSARDLIHKLLTRDYIKRNSAEDALKSDWIAKFHEKENNKVNVEFAKSILESIKEFSCKEKLQQATIAYIVHFLGAIDEVEELKKIFQLLDKSGDGRLTYSELREGFGRIFGKTVSDFEMEKIALDIDQDKNGYIEFEEFLRVSLNKTTLLSKENLKIAFDNFVKNGDGILSVEEIKEALGTENNDYIDKLVDKIDENHDGVISFTEFSNLMNSILNKESK